MPCNSGDDGASCYAELQEATRAACNVFSVLRKKYPRAWNAVKSKLEPETLAWLKEHDRIDADREKAEKAEAERHAARKKALDKLTKEEQRLLSLR